MPGMGPNIPDALSRSIERIDAGAKVLADVHVPKAVIKIMIDAEHGEGIEKVSALVGQRRFPRRQKPTLLLSRYARLFGAAQSL